MLCANCGEVIEEGEGLCRKCGTPVPKASEGDAAGASSLAGTRITSRLPDTRIIRRRRSAKSAATTRAVVTPPPTPPQSPPPPGTSHSAPPPSPPGLGYGPAWQPPPGSGGRGSNTGLLIGVVMAIVVVLAGAGVGAWFVLRDDQTAETTTTGVAASTTETTGSQSTVTTAPGATTQTVPNATGSSIGSTSTTAAGQKAAYVAAIGDLAADLEYDDDRIPVLATRINDTAPNVPAWVRDELEGMLDALDIASMNLAGLLVPPGFGRSHYWLEEAVRHMANRIYATIQGIEIMWSTGNVGSGDLYFNEGRTERDAYRSAIDKYYEFLPAE